MNLSLIALFAMGALAFEVSPPDGGENLRSLLQAERAFARMSVEMGMDTAFLANLADDAKLMRPGPVNGKLWIRLHPNTVSQLSWEPKFAIVSEAGDLGYTTGPWISKSLVDSSRPPRFGHFVSLWRRSATGVWKLEFDMGIVHDQPAPNHLNGFAEVQGRNAGGRGKVPQPLDKCEEELLARDGQFAQEFALRDGRSKCLSAYEPGALCYRMGVPPFIGESQFREVVLRSDDTLRFTPLAASVSRSCDLGYSYGSLEGRGDVAYYLRIWRRDSEGIWKVVLDLDNLPR